MNEKISVDFLIDGARVLSMDSAGTVYSQGAVAISGKDIVFVGRSDEAQKRFEPKQKIAAAGCVVMPGFVNAHTHAAMTLFRGYADDIPLEPWLDRIWELEKAYATAENVRIGAELAFAEMIRSGTTAAADMYWNKDAACEAAKKSGFRLISGPSFINFVGPDGIQMEDRDRLAREFLDQYKGDPLLGVCVQVHATYSVPREMLEMAAALVAEYDVPFVTHASESQQEVKTIVERTGMTPIEYLDDVGLLTPKTLLAHCVHLRDDEIDRLATRGASVAHCPESNLKIGNGIARTAEMLRRGVNVGLGTDGAATNNDLDMWGEMRTAALLQKGITGDPTVMDASTALRIATINGARAVSLQNKIGSLEVGKCADLIVVELDNLHSTPVYDAYSHLVYSADKMDVRDVFINGQAVMRNRELLTIDEEKVKAEIRQFAKMLDQRSDK
jgi:5-methylthioadenosine/S-adenosylhomocysteine deaminase